MNLDFESSKLSAQESEGARARGKKSSEVFRGVVETFRGGDAQLQTWRSSNNSSDRE